MKSTPNQIVTEITNAASNRVLTVGTVEDEQQDLNAESGLTYDGSTLAITGDATISGNLTVSGATASIQTTNTLVKDAIIELNNGSSTGNDAAIIVERGSTGDNAVIQWDESADEFVLGTTTATGSSTGNITVTRGNVSVANLDVDGTANLDAVDIDGSTQIDGTVTVGQNDTGYDVIFYGNTASANATWDASADDLIFNGAAGLVVPDGQLSLGSTAIGATAAEINAACDASARVAADVAVASDHILFCDGAADGPTKVESIAHLMNASAGTGISESSGQLNVDASQTQITAVGTLTGGTWNADVIASQFLDTDTAHLSGSQTFSGAKSFSSTVDITDTTDATGNDGDSGALRCEGGASIAKKLYVGTDLDVDGTTNLDAVDIDGAVQIDSTVTIGQNDTGYDVIFYGATASANLTWDASEDDLIVNGAARVLIPEGNLVLGSTAVTATAAEINLLDNVSGLVQADFTKLAAVTSSAAELNLLDDVSGLVQADFTKLAAVDSTAAEINLLDGGASVGGSITIADGDGFIVNDGGAMKTIPASDLKTYAGGGGTAADDSNLILHMQVFA